MRVWKIYTNERPLGVLVHGNISEKKIRERMTQYTKDKLAKGFKLSHIVYCYAPNYTESLP